MKRNNKQILFVVISILTVLVIFFLDQFFSALIPKIRMTYLNGLFKFLGSYEVGLIIYFVILSSFFLIDKKKELILYLLLAAFLSVAISYSLKYIVMRPRPIIELTEALIIKSTPSFPSTHTMIAASTYFFIKQLKKTKVIAFILVILVAISGLYNGTHYLSDVFAGVLLGVGVSYLVINYLPIVIKKINK